MQKNITMEPEKYIISIQISCFGLKIPSSRGPFAHLCPQAQLFKRKPKGWEEIGITERVKNIKNPFFFKKMFLDYSFTKLRKPVTDDDDNPVLKLVLFDVHKNKAPVIIGQTSIYFSSLEEKRQRRYVYDLKLQNGKIRGSVSINAELVLIESSKKNKIRMNLFAENVKNIEFLSLTDPFLVFYRPDELLIPCDDYKQIPEPNWTIVYKTEQVMDNLNPTFNDWVDFPDNISRNYDKCWMKVEIWDYSKKGRHSVLGAGYFRYGEIINNKILKVKTVDSKGGFTGTVAVKKTKLKKVNIRPSYDNLKLAILVKDHISLGVTIAIDFSEENSIYHIHKDQQLNRCLSTIRTIFWAMKPYIGKNKIRVYGCSASSELEKESEEEVVHKIIDPDIFKLGFRYDKGKYEKYETAKKHYYICCDSINGNLSFKIEPILDTIEGISKDNMQKYEWNECELLPYEVLVIITNGNSMVDNPGIISKKLEYLCLKPISVILISLGENYNDSFLKWNDNKEKDYSFRFFVNDGSVGIEKDYCEFSSEIFGGLVPQIEAFLSSKGIKI